MYTAVFSPAKCLVLRDLLHAAAQLAVFGFSSGTGHGGAAGDTGAAIHMLFALQHHTSDCESMNNVHTLT
jgi:hypothetical protein